MKEYLCMYDDKFIEFYIQRVKAISEGSATLKFNDWLESRGCCVIESDIITVEIETINEIEFIN